MTDLAIVSSQAGSVARQKVSSLRAANEALRSTIDQKALDVIGLDLQHVSDISDYFILATGTSERHVKGIADNVKRDLLALGEMPDSVSGYEGGNWVILDYSDFVVHIFYAPTRQFYNLDDLWKDARRMELPSDLELRARKLRTGMIR